LIKIGVKKSKAIKLDDDYDLHSILTIVVGLIPLQVMLMLVLCFELSKN